MTAERLLAILCSHSGVAISVDEGRLRVEAPRGLLTPCIRETLAVQKADVLQLVALIDEYRDFLSCADVEDSSFRVTQVRLIDELGPTLAAVVRQAAESKQPGLLDA
jgi:hypothetical protein